MFDEAQRDSTSTSDDSTLIDAYSAAVMGAFERAGPAVVHIAVRKERGGVGSGLVVASRPHPHQRHVVSCAKASRSACDGHIRRRAYLRDPHTDIAVRAPTRLCSAAAAMHESKLIPRQLPCHRNPLGFELRGPPAGQSRRPFLARRHWPLIDSHPTDAALNPGIPAARWSIRKALSHQHRRHHGRPGICSRRHHHGAACAPQILRTAGAPRQPRHRGRPTHSPPGCALCRQLQKSAYAA